MAYVKISEWTPEQVADWLTGLEDCLHQYISSFLNNEIDGRRLLMLARDDLQHLNVTKLGHQELLLEAAEQLRYSYYHLDEENLQWLAVRLSCKARSLSNDLISQMTRSVAAGTVDQDRVATTTLAAVADVLNSALCLASWLDRPPFPNQTPFRVMKSAILEYSVNLATIAQRDKFAVKPNKIILNMCVNLDKICDALIKESTEPLILQPASLDVATIKKKPNEELGIEVTIPFFTGAHMIDSVKLMSPALSCGRINPGDEIVQVNYQTVVGWQLKRLVEAMKEDPIEIILTLKKCPKHSTNFARIFPHHLLVPSKKSTPKLQRKISSGRATKVPPVKPPPLTQSSPPRIEATTEEDDDDSTFLPEVDGQQSVEARLDIPKLHVALQRRATITGASPTNDRPPVRMDELWQEVKRDQIMRSMSHDITATQGHTGHLWYQQAHHSSGDPSPQQREPAGDETTDVSSWKPQTLTRPLTCIGVNSELNSSTSWKKWTPISSDVLGNHTYESTGNQIATLKCSVNQATATTSSDNQTTNSRSSDNQTTNSRSSDNQTTAPKSTSNQLKVAESTSNQSKTTESTDRQTMVSKISDNLTTAAKSSDSPTTVPESSDNLTVVSERSSNQTTSESVSKQLMGSGSKVTIKEENRNDDKTADTSKVIEKEEFTLRPDVGHSTVVACSNASQKITVPDVSVAFKSISKDYHAPSLTTGQCQTEVNPASDVGYCPPKKPLQNPGDNEEVTSYQVVIVGGVPQKNPSPTKNMKTNSLRSPKLRGKVTLRDLANRRISCKDLGPGECQGWLYKGRVTTSLLHSHFKWTKRWCVLKSSDFYVYESIDSLKAECVISLIGFSCSPDVNCKSKKYAFKVYHSGTSFYFASSTQEDMVKWMNKIGLATISYDSEKQRTPNESTQPVKRSESPPGCIYYSETDEDLEDQTEKPKMTTEDENKEDRLKYLSSESNSSLSSISSYHSPLESYASSPRLDDRLQSEASSDQKNDSSSSEEEQEELKKSSWLHSDQPLSSDTSFRHQITPRITEPCEVFNPNVVVEDIEGRIIPDSVSHNLHSSAATAEDAVVFRSRRGGTLPAISSSRKAQTLSRLVKGTSMDFKGQLKSLETNSFSSTVGCGVEPAKMSLVFEMNLDTSSFTSSSLPVELQNAGEVGRNNITETRRSSTSSQTSQDSTRSLPISALKLFGSPKFVKKFTGHRTKSESKITSKSSKEAPEPLEGRLPPSRLLTPPQHKTALTKPVHQTKSDSERRFLGSPKLARAIYRAMQHHHKKTLPEDIGNSMVAKRLSSSPQPAAVTASNIALLQHIRISSIPSYPEGDDEDKISSSGTKSDRLASGSSSSSSSLTCSSCSSSDKLSQTSDVNSKSSVAPTTDSSESRSGTLRTSRKPAMGISMIGKQRRSSSQSSDSRSSHSHHFHPYATTSQATQTDIG